MADASEEFAAFRRQVIGDPVLFERMAVAKEGDEFVTLAVKVGQELGWRFGPDDVKRELNAARRAWLERGVA